MGALYAEFHNHTQVDTAYMYLSYLLRTYVHVLYVSEPPALSESAPSKGLQRKFHIGGIRVDFEDMRVTGSDLRLLMFGAVEVSLRLYLTAQYDICF